MIPTLRPYDCIEDEEKMEKYRRYLYRLTIHSELLDYIKI
jgi:hypothetical protein